MMFTFSWDFLTVHVDWRNDGCFYMSFEDWVPRRAAYHLRYVTSYLPSDFPTKVSIGDNDESCSRSTLKQSKTCTSRQDLALQLWIVDLCPKGTSHISPVVFFIDSLGCFYIGWCWALLTESSYLVKLLTTPPSRCFHRQFWQPVLNPCPHNIYMVKNNKTSVVIQAKPLPTLWGANFPNVSK